MSCWNENGLTNIDSSSLWACYQMQLVFCRKSLMIHWSYHFIGRKKEVQPKTSCCCELPLQPFVDSIARQTRSQSPFFERGITKDRNCSPSDQQRSKSGWRVVSAWHCNKDKNSIRSATHTAFLTGNMSSLMTCEWHVPNRTPGMTASFSSTLAHCQLCKCSSHHF